MDYRWAIIYLKLTMTPSDIVDAELQGLLPRRVRNQGRKPTILSYETDEVKEGKPRKDRWWFPKPPKLFTNEEKKSVTGCVIEQLVRLVFGTHFYMWDGEVYHQQKGAPMGLRSSCPASRAVMDFWIEEVRKLEEKMASLNTINPIRYEKLETYLIKKYVDDVMTALETMKKGVRWDQVHQIMVWSSEHQMEDKDRSEQEVTMRAFSDMASGILKCLNFTWDLPELNNSGKMPVLDTMMWKEKHQRTWGVPQPLVELGTSLPQHTGQVKQIIMYEFYRKPMATKTPMHQRSATPERDKVQTAVNEFIRRFKNTSRQLKEDNIEQVVKEYCTDLRRGGFSPKWIRNALDAASKGYSRLVTAEVKEGLPINRPEKTGRISRRVKKLVGKATWFKKSSPVEKPTRSDIRSGRGAKNQVKSPAAPESVLFVPFTPGGELKKILQKVDSEVTGSRKFGKVKVVETLGQKVIESLGNKVPWRGTHCKRPGCTPCQVKPGSCKARNITYQVTCDLCGMVYWGESHRTWHDRSAEHVSSLRTGNQANALVKHRSIHHQNEATSFTFKLDRSWKTSLQRQIREGLKIQQTDCDLLMNSRSEWGNNGIPRVVVQDTRHQTNVATGLPTRHTPDTNNSHPCEPNPEPSRKKLKSGADFEVSRVIAGPQIPAFSQSNHWQQCIDKVFKRKAEPRTPPETRITSVITASNIQNSF